MHGKQRPLAAGFKAFSPTALRSHSEMRRCEYVNHDADNDCYYYLIVIIVIIIIIITIIIIIIIIIIITTTTIYRCAQPPCVYARIRTHGNDPVVHVRFRWNTETNKDPACTLLTEGLID